MNRRSQYELVKPAALNPGDTVGVIAPASAVDRELFLAGCAAIESAGYQVLYLDSVFERELFFAGSLKRRVDELHAMFDNPDVRAIVCARGGYGCNYLLPHLDLELIRANPKIFMGYSDVTTLLTWLRDAAGLMTYHGPMVTKDFTGDAAAVERNLSIFSSMLGPQSWQSAGLKMLSCAPGASEMVPGSAEGELYGGCLSMLAASLGTPFEVQTDGRILFIEDIATKPYQLDRMLMQMRLAGKFDRVKAILFGEMVDCVQPGGQEYSLLEVMERAVGDLGVPVGVGLASGHVVGANFVLPLGARVRVRVATSVEIEMLEPTTSKPLAGAGAHS